MGRGALLTSADGPSLPPTHGQAETFPRLLSGPPIQTAPPRRPSTNASHADFRTTLCSSPLPAPRATAGGLVSGHRWSGWRGHHRRNGQRRHGGQLPGLLNWRPQCRWTGQSRCGQRDGSQNSSSSCSSRGWLLARLCHIIQTPARARSRRRHRRRSWGSPARLFWTYACQRHCHGAGRAAS